MSAPSRLAAAPGGVGGGHEGGYCVLAGLDVLLEGGQPFVPADGHEEVWPEYGRNGPRNDQDGGWPGS